MPEKENNGANKQLVTPIELLLRDGRNLPPEELARRIVATVSNTKGLTYGTPKELPLLTSAARVLLIVIQEPNITVRALAIYLGVSEAAVLKSLKLLLDKNLIAKTKVNGKNNYTIVKESFENHSDITNLIRAAAIVSGMGQLEPDEDIF